MGFETSWLQHVKQQYKQFVTRALREAEAVVARDNALTDLAPMHNCLTRFR